VLSNRFYFKIQASEIETMNKFLVFASLLVLISVPSAFAATYNVEITHGMPADCTTDCYTPALIRIAPGDSVTWTNVGDTNHNVISGNPVDGIDGMFDSQLLLPGESFTYVFPMVEGEYPYYDFLHTWAQGLVVVGGDTVSVPQSPVITENGTIIEQPPIVKQADEVEFKPVVKINSDETLNKLYPDSEIKVISNVGLDVDNEVSFSVPYIADGDFITSSITPEAKALSFSFREPQMDGTVIIKLDPALIDGVDAVWYTDTKDGGGVLDFTITQDGEFNVISFELPHKPIRGVSMSGSHVVPEFGSIAAIILVVAVISIVIATRKTPLMLKSN
jgi:predicted secreted protein with PEFG-CTERM motif